MKINKLFFQNIIWFFFYTQPFITIQFGYTTLSIVLVITGLIYLGSSFRINSYELILFLIPVVSVIFWIFLGKLEINELFDRDKHRFLYYTLLPFLVAFGILKTINSNKDIICFLKMSFWYVIGVLVLSIISICTGDFFKTGHIDITGFERAGGWTHIPNVYSTYLVLAVMFCYLQYMFSKKLIYIYIMILFLIFLVLTVSRNGLLGAILFFFCFYYYNNKTVVINSIGSRVKKLPSMLFMIITACIIVFTIYGNIFIGLFTRFIGKNILLENGRVGWWLAHFNSMSHWQVTDFLFGIYYNNLLNNLIHGLPYVIPKESYGTFSTVENGFLYFFLSSGIVGFSMLLFLIFKTVRKALQIINKKDKQHLVIAIFTISFIASISIQAFFTDYMYMSNIVYFYTIMGVINKIRYLDGPLHKEIV